MLAKGKLGAPVKWAELVTENHFWDYGKTGAFWGLAIPEI
jgi:hypothetical protein